MLLVEKGAGPTTWLGDRACEASLGTPAAVLLWHEGATLDPSAPCTVWLWGSDWAPSVRFPPGLCEAGPGHLPEPTAGAPHAPGTARSARPHLPSLAATRRPGLMGLSGTPFAPGGTHQAQEPVAAAQQRLGLRASLPQRSAFGGAAPPVVKAQRRWQRAPQEVSSVELGRVVSGGFTGPAEWSSPRHAEGEPQHLPPARAARVPLGSGV